MARFELTEKGKKQLAAAALIAVHEMGERIYSEAAQNLTEAKYGGHIITDTGELLSSEEFIPHKKGATIRFTASHASDVEYGIPAGTKPPIEDLTRWAKRKLGLSQKEAASAAWGIQTNIYKNGTEPRPFLRNAMYTVQAYYNTKKIGK